ncbi:IS1595 family transposase [Lysobacteraceae bacterium NML07-0707]|nr:IS1595 family transposase [Xanthomonadaceae bacterium NML07-0707]
MTRKNRYYYRSRIAEKTFRKVLRYFALDLSASDTARLTGVSLRSINAIYIKLRERIAVERGKHSPWSGQVEVDESYFGPRRVRGKRGRGAGSKTIVFGLFKRNGWVSTEIVPDVKKATLQKAIRGKVALDSVIHSDGWRGYHGLVDVGYARHLRVNHQSNAFANDQTHINGIESFWAYAKLRLAKMKGIRKDMFYLHLKETEFRFNHRRDNLYKLMMKMLREQPI